MEEEGRRKKRRGRRRRGRRREVAMIDQYQECSYPSSEAPTEVG